MYIYECIYVYINMYMYLCMYICMHVSVRMRVCANEGKKLSKLLEGQFVSHLMHASKMVIGQKLSTDISCLKFGEINCVRVD